MLFNTAEFAVFMAVVFTVYVAVGRLADGRRLQNRLLLVASYLFYGWWDWRFLSLIAFSTGVDYVVAHKIAASNITKMRKHLLWVSLAVNLGLLAVFKYLGFFVESAREAALSIGLDPPAYIVELVLPVGISFYTFQTLSYTIDVYKRELEPTDDFFDFALFVAFFPQLVAGPIFSVRPTSCPSYSRSARSLVRSSSRALGWYCGASTRKSSSPTTSLASPTLSSLNCRTMSPVRLRCLGSTLLRFRFTPTSQATQTSLVGLRDGWASN